MVDTALMRIQHEELIALTAKISSYFSSLTNDAEEVRLQLALLGLKLRTHLALEDHALYPQLFQYENNSVKDLATLYLEEMGGLHATFGIYKGKWGTKERIQEAPDEFIQDTTEMFAELINRIKREDTELYDLVDKL